MNQKGFTLIELVVVIVILGILAVIAAPKFINIQTDARISTLESLLGSIKSTNNLIYSKSIIEGMEDIAYPDLLDRNKLLINGTNIQTHKGYFLPTLPNLKVVMDISDREWGMFSMGGFYGLIIGPKNNSNNSGYQDILNSKCFVEYKFASSAAAQPSYTISKNGC